MVETSRLIFDPDYYPREFTDFRTVARYRTAMDGGSEFPPLDVVAQNGGFLVLDGEHRRQAYKKVGAERVKVHVLDLPESKWLPFAVAANARNGRPYTVKEHTMIVHRLRSGGLNDQEIAELLSQTSEWIFGVAERAIFQALEDGSDDVISLKRALLEVKDLVQSKVDDPKTNLNLKGIQRHMSGQMQAHMLGQVVHLIESGLLNDGDSRVASYIDRLKTALCK